MQATLLIGMFPLIFIGTWLALMPGEFWDWCESRVPRLFRIGGAIGDRLKRLFSFVEVRPVRRQLGLPARLLFIALAVISLSAEMGPYVRLPKPLVKLQTLTHTWQSFNVYVYMKGGFVAGPRIKDDYQDVDGWLVRVAYLRSGAQVRLTDGGPVVWSRPGRGKPLRATWQDTPRSGWWWFIEDHRWFKYSQRVGDFMYGMSNGALFGPAYGRYLCRRWSATHPGPDDLVRVVLYSVIETSLYDPKADPAKIETVPFLDYRCGDPIVAAH
jgi:hypothetical protein